MTNKPKLRYPVLAEGKYDKIKITSLFDAQVLTTGGFSLYNNEEKKAFIRRLGQKTPVIVLTDSDNAGRQIRNFVKELLPRDRQIHLYTPQVTGREKRKSAPSAEGYLGVEGTDKDTLRGLLAPYTEDAAKDPKGPEPKAALTRIELYERGYIGGENSAEKRKELLTRAGLPRNLSVCAMLEALNLLYTRPELEELL